MFKFKRDDNTCNETMGTGLEITLMLNYRMQQHRNKKQPKALWVWVRLLDATL